MVYATYVALSAAPDCRSRRPSCPISQQITIVRYRETRARTVCELPLEGSRAVLAARYHDRGTGRQWLPNASVLNFDSGWRVMLNRNNMLNKPSVEAMANGTDYFAIAMRRTASRYFDVQQRRDFF
jgi:hypothetical protein